jgi:hypothetical protein
MNNRIPADPKTRQSALKTWLQGKGEQAVTIFMGVFGLILLFATFYVLTV